MGGKTVLVTGASSGIGKATALGLALQGHRVILGCRNAQGAEAARAEIAAQAGADRVATLGLDLASFASVRKAADEVAGRFDRLDVLVLNAGIFPRRLARTEDGFELQLGVNHLGHFLLANLLLPLLARSAPARVVTVASMMHAGGRIDFESFRGEKGYDAMTAYRQSKLANVLFSNELARRAADRGITSNALHPGGIRTAITRDAPPWMRLLARIAFSPVEKGARTPIFLAVSPEVEGVTGGYFVDCERREPAPLARDRDLARRLWDESARLVGVAA
jgi:NAD(P)-dependent dehydrogenase (short-subunit alcohol dehydrogenase family)